MAHSRRFESIPPWSTFDPAADRIAACLTESVSGERARFNGRTLSSEGVTNSAEARHVHPLSGRPVMVRALLVARAGAGPSGLSPATFCSTVLSSLHAEPRALAARRRCNQSSQKSACWNPVGCAAGTADRASIQLTGHKKIDLADVRSVAAGCRMRSPRGNGLQVGTKVYSFVSLLGAAIIKMSHANLAAAAANHDDRSG